MGGTVRIDDDVNFDKEQNKNNLRLEYCWN